MIDNDGIEGEKAKMDDAITAPPTTTRKALGLDDVQDDLNAMARKIGAVYGVDLGVGRVFDVLMFVDSNSVPIADRFDKKVSTGAVCATADEIDQGVFLKLFAARALYAALIQRFEQSRAQE